MNPITMAGIKERPRIRPKYYGLLFFCLIAAGLFLFSAYEQTILTALKDNQEWMQATIDAAPVLGRVLFVAGFALVIGFYIPGGVVLLLLSGALFPQFEANILANTGNLLGALIGFLLSRHLFFEEVQARYGARLKLVNRGIRQHGWLYLFILRLAPIMPSPVVNLMMGLTPIPVPTYVLATLFGRIPMTALYVKLGAELSEINRMSDILSVEITGSLILLSLLLLGGNHLLKRKSV